MVRLQQKFKAKCRQERVQREKRKVAEAFATQPQPVRRTDNGKKRTNTKGREAQAPENVETLQKRLQLQAGLLAKLGGKRRGKRKGKGNGRH